MPGNEAARVLHTEPSLGHGLSKIAELSDNRKPRAYQHQGQYRGGPEEARGRPAGKRRATGAADQSRPGFARAPARREPRPAKLPPDPIGADLGGPDHGEGPPQGRP